MYFFTSCKIDEKVGVFHSVLLGLGDKFGMPKDVSQTTCLCSCSQAAKRTCSSAREGKQGAKAGSKEGRDTVINKGHSPILTRARSGDKQLVQPPVQ